MKREWGKYMAGVALGFSLFAGGCEKKEEDPSTLGLAPPSTPEKSASDEGTMAPNPGYDQGPSGASKDQSPEGPQKSERGQG
jgi:hypothetical protein